MSDVTTLEEVCAGLGPDELRVLVLVAERLRKGRACYGKLRIESDSRTWRAELREDLNCADTHNSAIRSRGEGAQGEGWRHET